LSIQHNHFIKSVMTTQKRVTVRPVSQNDRQQLANLIHFETHVHRHLDWRPPLDWLGHSPYLVAERESKIISALSCPPDPPDIAWIRLFAVSAHSDPEEAWSKIWPVAQAELHDRKISTVAAIPLMKWFQSLLENHHFQHIHNVVLLLWQPGFPLPEERSLNINIRPMNYDDLLAVQDVDGLAFGSIWRNSLESLELAFKQAAVATVAEEEGKVLGYQISTSNPLGGHLARLAVHPKQQGKGIGFSLVRDMLHQFERRGASRVSVNTQQDNSISLSLYQKSGFQKTDEIYPVYQFRPAKNIG
jgi:ribosomal protein S18 acetylase RimI-like enzyme